MPGRLSFSLMDHSREKSRFSLATGEVTAVSLPGLLTQVGALRTAIEGITRGVVSNEALSVFDTPLAQLPPADELAQVEVAWLVTYMDVTEFFDDPINAIPNEGSGRLFTVSIPTADIQGRLQPYSDYADMDDTDIQAFVSAFEAIARSPYGGEVSVVSLKHVGRNR